MTSYNRLHGLMFMCYASICCLYFVFFFQAEDGIRDVAVTGVQTCALPIYRRHTGRSSERRARLCAGQEDVDPVERRRLGLRLDRKSTRLNSSHGYISYAVFCLKKKKKK